MSNRFKQKTYWLTIGLLLIFIGLCFLISMNTGLMTLSPNEIFQTLIGNGTSQQELILYDFRLPRISLAILVGAGLAISGCILQGVTRNPLADTGILGINAGAGIAVLLFVTYFSSASGSSVFLLPIIAFIGAAVATLLIYLLSYKKGEGITTTRFVLTGVAVAAGITALMIVFTLRLSPTKYQFITTWLAGSIWGSSWVFVWVLLLWLVILVPLAFRKAKVLDLFSLGEEATIGLGVNLEKERVILLSIAVAIAGVSVSVSGGIGFIGLLAPHLARQLVGSRHRYLLPLSALIGSSLLIVADTLGRVVISPAEMPAGILVSIIGAPDRKSVV